MILPDLAELLALRGSARGLSLHAHRPALARLMGGQRSAQRGRGLEFEEVRPYAPGDDARRIDWRVTARRGKPHTKLFREERERPVWLLLDLNPGLFFGSKRQLKSALLLRAAALLGWVAVEGGDRLGAVVQEHPDDARLVVSRRGPQERSQAVLDHDLGLGAPGPGTVINQRFQALKYQGRQDAGVLFGFHLVRRLSRLS